MSEYVVGQKLLLNQNDKYIPLSSLTYSNDPVL